MSVPRRDDHPGASPGLHLGPPGSTLELHRVTLTASSVDGGTAMTDTFSGGNDTISRRRRRHAGLRPRNDLSSQRHTAVFDLGAAAHGTISATANSTASVLTIVSGIETITAGAFTAS